MNIKTYDSTPNFSIVMPGPCNANCSFCDYKAIPISPDFIKNLERSFEILGDKVTQVSITGGEPTISPYLSDVLRLLRKYPKFKVVLTTNGTQLETYIGEIDGVVDHINVSRHSTLGVHNREIFGCHSIISNGFLKMLIQCLNISLIDVTLNKVIWVNHDSITEIYRFVDFAHDINATSLCFRKDWNSNTLEPTPTERRMGKKYKEEKCPVCVSRQYLINGMYVYFKAGLKEPSDIIDEVFEFVYQADGVLYKDWSRKKPIDL
jgi:molybdenum cofactor biosynthesis enzyme MoaA